MGLGWGQHCIAPWSRCRPLGWPSSQSGPCLLTPGASPLVQQPFQPAHRPHCLSGAMAASFPLQPLRCSSPAWALLVPKGTKRTLLSCFIYSSAPLLQVCVQNPKARPALPGVLCGQSRGWDRDPALQGCRARWPGHQHSRRRLCRGCGE